MDATRIYRNSFLALGMMIVLVASCAMSSAAAQSPGGVQKAAFTGVVACEGGGSHPFTAAVLRRPRNAERGRSPSARALRRFLRTSWIGELYPKHRWFIFSKWRSGAKKFITFASGRLTSMSTMTFERKRRGEWEWVGSGGGECFPRRLVEPNLASTRWHLDPTRLPIDPAATSIWVSMDELACNSGRNADGRASMPIVRYEPHQIVMLGKIKPNRGTHTCPSNPPTFVEVRLTEPIGDRALVDGGSVPVNTRLSLTQLLSLRAGVDPLEVLNFQRTDNELCRDAAEGSAALPGFEWTDEQRERFGELRHKCPRYEDRF